MSELIVEDKKEICFSCQQEGDDLVRSCKTPNCNAKFHSKCLEERIKSDKKSCPECEYPIVVERLETFNWTKCGKVYFGFIFTFVMVIGGTLFNIKSALGDSPMNPFSWDNRGCYAWREGTNPHTVCDKQSVGIIILSIVLSLMFWQFPSLMCRNSKTNVKEGWRYNIFGGRAGIKNDKLSSYVTMFIMFFLSQIIITITHTVGQHTSSMTVRTWETFEYGLITYLWVLLCLAIIILCAAIPYGIYSCTVKEFTNIKTVVGVPQLKSLSNKSKVI